MSKKNGLKAVISSVRLKPTPLNGDTHITFVTQVVIVSGSFRSNMVSPPLLEQYQYRICENNILGPPTLQELVPKAKIPGSKRV